jgi:ribosomal protein L3 glutamine methyltransferase
MAVAREPRRAQRNKSHTIAAPRIGSLGALVRHAADRLNRAGLAFGHGNTTALDEAAYLVMHSLGLRIGDPAPPWAMPVTERDIAKACALIERRIATRAPAAYLTREAWIGPYRFYVDERAIVPRSFIGHWLLGDLSHWIDRAADVKRVLDLCTGSGCLAILAAKTFPNARVDAIDISADALAVAARNITDYKLDHRIRLLRGDLYSPCKGSQYDLIVANPPYVTAAAMRKLPAEYRREPPLALAGGHDGLDIVRRILAQAREHLNPAGLLVVEVGHTRARVERAFPGLALTWIEIGGVDDAVFLLRAPQVPARASRARAR